MRITICQFRRLLKGGAGVALATACTGGLALFDWIPGSTGSAIGEHVALASNDVAQLRVRTRFPGKARCAACLIEEALKGATDGDASRGEQCTDDGGSGKSANHAIQGAHAANLAVLLDWHATAHIGYGFDSDGIFCSAQSARALPLPIAASDVYEQLAHPRDATSLTSVNGDSPGAAEKALQKVAD